MGLDALDPLHVKRRVDSILNARRTLLPLPLVDRPRSAHEEVLPSFELRPATALAGKSVGVVAAGGSGAAVALVGVVRAFEEAGVQPSAISASSGSVLWSAMWAAGMTSDEMSEFSLSWQPQDHLDIQWARLPHFALSALRGFTGLAKGAALERLFDRRLWHMSAGETEIALHTAVYNLDRGRVEWFGSDETPDLTLGELVRIAVAHPDRSEAVRVEGELYADGGVIDGFPSEPIAGAHLDRVFGIDLAGAPAPMAELRSVQRAELARRSRERLGDRLTPIETGAIGGSGDLGFYDLFIDRRRWPELMRQGYEAAAEALAPFRRGEGGAA